MQRDEWKFRLKELMRDCHDEISKATVIGKKMINATQTNTCLNDSYEELGRLAAKHMKAGILEWENPRVDELLEEIKLCEKNLQIIEKEVCNIKVKSFDDQSDSTDDSN